MAFCNLQIPSTQWSLHFLCPTEARTSITLSLFIKRIFWGMQVHSVHLGCQGQPLQCMLEIRNWNVDMNYIQSFQLFPIVYNEKSWNNKTNQFHTLPLGFLQAWFRKKMKPRCDMEVKKSKSVIIWLHCHQLNRFELWPRTLILFWTRPPDE